VNAMVITKNYTSLSKKGMQINRFPSLQNTLAHTRSFDINHRRDNGNKLKFETFLGYFPQMPYESNTNFLKHLPNLLLFQIVILPLSKQDLALCEGFKNPH
jgi:hypothetical protein